MTKRKLVGTCEIDIRNLDTDVEFLATFKHENTKLSENLSRICGLTIYALRGAARDRITVRKRWRAMYLLRQLGFSYPRIGVIVNRDHSACMYGIQQVEDEIAAHAKGRAA